MNWRPSLQVAPARFARSSVLPLCGAGCVGHEEHKRPRRFLTLWCHRSKNGADLGQTSFALPKVSSPAATRGVVSVSEGVARPVFPVALGRIIAGTSGFAPDMRTTRGVALGFQCRPWRSRDLRGGASREDASAAGALSSLCPSYRGERLPIGVTGQATPTRRPLFGGFRNIWGKKTQSNLKVKNHNTTQIYLTPPPRCSTGR